MCMSIEKNFHQVHEERNTARKEVKSLEKDKNGKGSVLHQFLDKILKEREEEHNEFKISDYGGLSEAKRKIKEDKEDFKNQGPDISYIKEELGPEFGEVYDTLQEKQKLEDQQFSFTIKAQENPKNQIYKSSLDVINEEISKVNQKYIHNKTENPVFARASELITYKEELAREGHIAITPQTAKDLEKIGDAIAIGRPMLLHGSTGTGKTSLARYAAEHYTGKKAEMIYCNPQFRETTAYGKTGLKANEKGQTETVDIMGPLTRAITEGKVCVLDEFTALPQEQMVFIKGILNARPGDQINIPNDGQKIIAPGFQIILTANLKSEKNKERAGLPPEIANEYNSNNLEIKYTPASEAYDIALARLMNEKGEISLSKYDLDETLPNLMKTISEIQGMYSGQIPEDAKNVPQISNTTGKVKGLEKLVINQRTIASMIDQWKLQALKGNQKSFVEFLDDELAKVIMFKEYSDSDRKLAASWLSLRGFLRTKTETELGLEPNSLKGLKSTNAESLENDISESKQIEDFSIKEIAEFDPFATQSKTFEEEIPEEILQKEKKSQKEALPVETISTKEQFQELITAINPKNYLNEGIMENIDQILPLSIEKDLSKYDGYKFGTEAYPTMDETQNAMKEQGYRPANGAELLYWVKEREEIDNITDKNVIIGGKEYNKYYWLCADESSVLLVGGVREVLSWDRGGGKRYLVLNPREDDWTARGFFLAVRN